MEKNQTIEMHRSNHWDLVSWLFGIAVFASGLLNTFWGNDPVFGVFLLLLAFVYFPPVNIIVKKWLGIGIPGWLKIILGLLITWVVLGVGELFGKLDLMMQSL